ncbi:MAG TPA: mandelate racemase/muconate lactonizing enzyme family protein [Bryobacteraceae bacterium]|jgi:L-alanine-DL-glutamate epimerase-like enolase superfamily enzyme|nr:mandelate racemase/muconate lactonizing enzyme family protein [Bryobacteraceae bacterium]
MPAFLKSNSDSAIRIEEISHSYQDFRYRAPYKFGGHAVDRVTLLNVECRVSLRTGRSAKGFGSMTMGNVWSFPSPSLTYDQTLGAMKALAGKINSLTASYREYGHPIDLNFALEPSYLNAAQEVTRELNLPEPIPKLCTLVTASPFDAALHDAFGKIHGRNVYQTYGPDLLPNDLSKYLGADYKGRWLHEYLLQKSTPAMPVYHSVGALDPLTPAEVTKPIHDGLPETLPEWISHSGIDHIKIKLNGDDLDWDLNRVLNIDTVTVPVQAGRGVATWFYSLDFNERCRDVDYLLRFIHRLKERNPAAFQRIQYIEQPTARDLASDRRNVMFEASKLVPVVIDESLTGLDMLLLARDMGYTGAALKACKGQSQAVLMAAAGQIQKMFLCVQDLTCPGASLIQSAGLAAHVPGVAGIEANAREYVPAANDPWKKKFPGIFDITNGRMATETLTGLGLGAV